MSDMGDSYDTWSGAMATTNQDDGMSITVCCQVWTARYYNVTAYAAFPHYIY